jgi:excinuclease ABC subunit C
VAFLSRPQTRLVGQMRRQMMGYAQRLEFERAQWLKLRVEALEQALQPQVVERHVAYDEDVIYFGERQAFVGRVRRGILCAFLLADLPLLATEWLLERYAQNSPQELIVNRLDDDGISRTLSASNGYRVRVTVPRRGEKAALLRLCEQNYLYRTAGRLEEVVSQPPR